MFFIVFAASTAAVATAQLRAPLISFVTLGDWGGAGLEDYHKVRLICCLSLFF